MLPMPLSVLEAFTPAKPSPINAPSRQRPITLHTLITDFTAAYGRLPTEAEVIVMLERRGWRPAVTGRGQQSPETLTFRGQTYIR